METHNTQYYVVEARSEYVVFGPVKFPEAVRTCEELNSLHLYTQNTPRYVCVPEGRVEMTTSAWHIKEPV